MSHDSLAASGRYDVVVVGSGFGGAAVACRLAQAGRSVAVLERGQEYPLGHLDAVLDRPDTRSIGHGHFQVDLGAGMSVIRGIGVGGGSLHYFGVRLRARPEIFDGPRWPASITRAVLDPYYDLAGDTLNASPVRPHPVLGFPAHGEAFLAAARQCRRCQGEPAYVPIAVHTSEEPVQTPAGIPQTRCVFCGECLLGCPASASFEGNVNARALLTLNYLAVARKHGAAIFPHHCVNQIKGSGDGFCLSIGDRTGESSSVASEVTGRQVVLAAGTLGTTELLLKSRDSLPPLSPLLGHHFSGNGDFLIPRTKNVPRDVQPTSGPTITAGGDFSTPMNYIFIEDLGRIPFLEAVVGRRGAVPTDIRRHDLGYLGMGTDAGDGVLQLRNGKVTVEWNPAASLPMYNEMIAALRELSQQLGGEYASPEQYDPNDGTGLVTAHPLGGCVMADSADEGVVNPRGEVHGVPGLFVADGAMVPSALATNPSYTITALAERVAFWMIHGREMTPGDDATPANQ